GTAAELDSVFDVVGSLSDPAITHTDRRCADQRRRFPDDRAIMLVAEYHERIVGGAFAFRRDPSTATLRNMGVLPAHQGQQLERRLVQKIEQGAVALGVRTINLGGVHGADREFLLGMGYRGRREGGLMSNPLARQRVTGGGRR